MLVLLVVFIVTAPLLTNAIPLKLPQTNAVAPPDQAKPLVVSVDKQGNYFLDTEPLSLEEVGARVREAHSQDPARGVQLRADENVVYAKVAQAMAVIQQSGITRLAVMTDAKG
ncbi:ExbD/TolR family protein [Biostraticola tofi]|uniref:Outer membrane transport energization protein ExbD n=1 Tax=Biostraticola tofi TaxID=466109 RepID=A0A4R3Z4V7_9GAMM|nr:biopolymer transporter ExbD [Biostraticola tofi]TCV98948.1 outer membrane transport energization protein ExbD [Biostraticola tofi]